MTKQMLRPSNYAANNHYFNRLERYRILWNAVARGL